MRPGPLVIMRRVDAYEQQTLRALTRHLHPLTPFRTVHPALETRFCETWRPVAVDNISQ